MPATPPDSLHVSTLRESFERASLPALTYLNGLPRFVPFLGILVLALAGILLPSPGWLLLVVVISVLLDPGAGLAAPQRGGTADAACRRRDHGRRARHPGGVARLTPAV